MQGASKRTLHKVVYRTGMLLWRRMGRRGLYIIYIIIRILIEVFMHFQMHGYNRWTRFIFMVTRPFDYLEDGEVKILIAWKTTFLVPARLIVSIFLNVVAASSDDTAQVENVMSCLRSKSSYDISLAAGVKSKYVSYLATVTYN